MLPTNDDNYDDDYSLTDKFPLCIVLLVSICIHFCQIGIPTVLKLSETLLTPAFTQILILRTAVYDEIMPFTKGG